MQKRNKTKESKGSVEIDRSKRKMTAASSVPHSVSTVSDTLKAKILSLVFLLLLGLSNALWGSTVGIAVHLASFYGVQPGTIKGNLPNSIYYAFYMIASIPCFFYNKLLRAFGLALFLSFIGIAIRIQFFLPAPEDEGTTVNVGQTLLNALQGINGQIIANAVIASAQPFAFGFILPMTSTYVSEHSVGKFIGATYTFPAAGYAIGYLVSVYRITSVDDYDTEFRDINFVYLAVASILIFLFGVALFPYSRLSKFICPRLHREEDQLRSVIALARSLEMDSLSIVVRGDSKSPQSGSRTSPLGASPTVSSPAGSFQSPSSAPSTIGSNATLAPPAVRSTGNSNASSRCGGSAAPMALVFVYTIIVAVGYLIGNYLDNVLDHKLLTEDQTFTASMLYLLPGIPFPVIVGYFIDKTKQTWVIGAWVLLLQLISQTIFLFVQSVPVIYMALTINSMTITCFTSSSLSLLAEMVDEKREKNYNNAMFTFSILLTFVCMLVPVAQQYYTTFFVVLTSVTCLGFVVYYRLPTMTSMRLR